MFAAAGACHSILLDSCGKAYTCGKGRGLLGHGNTCMCTVPTCVESLQVMQLPYECNCTCKHTMICKNINDYMYRVNETVSIVPTKFPTSHTLLYPLFRESMLLGQQLEWLGLSSLAQRELATGAVRAVGNYMM